MLTNIGVIGDIHAESVQLRTALEFLHMQNLDEILCVGDVVDGNGDVNECCDLLKQYQVSTVMGNHDKWFISNSMRDLPETTQTDAVSDTSRQFIHNLPLELEFQTTGGMLLLCHGLGKNTMAKVRDDDYGYALESNFELQELLQSKRYRYLLNGHTHYRMMRDFGGLTVINAGSLKYADAGFMTIHFTERRVRVYGLNTSDPEVINEMRIQV